MVNQFLFGLSLETLLIIILLVILIIILFVRKGAGGVVAMAATIPLFWLFSKKLGGSENELQKIRSDYDDKLQQLRMEFNTKIESIRQDLRSNLQNHRSRAISLRREIEAVDMVSKEQLQQATPAELEELAKGLLSIHKKEVSE